MKALGVTGPDFMPRLFDADEPIAAPDGVVVDVIAASINDFDRAAVRGGYLTATDQFVPILLGRDFVGRVVAVGDDVHHIEVGMHVAGVLAPQSAGQPGSFADKVAVPARLLAPLPEGVAVAQAAAVGLAGVTAFHAVAALGSAPLGHMVVHGPVCAIGGFALQLAKARGAVVAAITPPEQSDLALDLGADLVIGDGVSATRSIQKVRNLFGDVDTAIHVAGHHSVVAEVVRPGGRFTTTTAADGSTFHARGGFSPTNVDPSGHVLTDLLFKVAAHRLDSRVHRTISFDDLAGAVIARSTHDGGRTILIR